MGPWSAVNTSAKAERSPSARRAMAASREGKLGDIGRGATVEGDSGALEASAKRLSAGGMGHDAVGSTLRLGARALGRDRICAPARPKRATAPGGARGHSAGRKAG